MTYCVAVKVDEGLVFCSDSRTNAGPDMLSSYSKMHRFNPDPERFFVLLSAGNLSTTQAIISHLEKDLDQQSEENLATCSRLTEVAAYIGRITREETDRVQKATASIGVDATVSLIFGGQIGTNSPHELFLIYSAGNFITATEETAFLQIGESKYGKPILDRIITPHTTLGDSARCCLVSMDSTIKSNATVGPPIEILVYQKNSFLNDRYVKIEADDPYLLNIKEAWNEAVKLAFHNLPPFYWEAPPLITDQHQHQQ